MKNTKKYYYMSWDEFEQRVNTLAKKIKKNRKIKDIFGIPRGGLIPAVMLSHLTDLPITANPKGDSTVIVDDCIDSGATHHSFCNFKHFYVLVDKQEEGEDRWIVYPWEKQK
jgi:uncharacterized protein